MNVRSGFFGDARLAKQPSHEREPHRFAAATTHDDPPTPPRMAELAFERRPATAAPLLDAAPPFGPQPLDQLVHRHRADRSRPAPRRGRRARTDEVTAQRATFRSMADEDDRDDSDSDRSEAARDPYASLQARLDEGVVWPSVYTFKFIMRTEHVEAFVAILAGHRYTTRASGEGRHTAITAELFMESSAEVIALYRRAAEFPGVISL